MTATIADTTKKVIERAKSDPAKNTPPMGSLYYPPRDDAAKREPCPPVPDSLLEDAHGLFGDLARWVKRGDPDAPNGLCLLSALSIMSTLCGRGFVTPSNCGVSLQMVGLAPSGAGKDWALKAPNVALQACANQANPAAIVLSPNRPIDADEQAVENQIDAFTLIAASPSNFTSDAAIYNELWRSAISLVRMDEFGSTLARWSRESSHEAAIPSMLRTIYSRGIVSPRGYAANPNVKDSQLDRKRRASLHDPHMTLFGVSTPRQFYSAAHSGMTENGTLNRFIILDEVGQAPTLAKARDKLLGDGNDARAIVPRPIIDRMLNVFNNGKSVIEPAQGLGVAVSYPHTERMDVTKAVDVVKVKFSNDEASELWIEFVHERNTSRFEKTQRDAENDEAEEANAMARTGENAIRVATLYAIGDTPQINDGDAPVIRAKHMQWAMQFMELAEAHLKTIIGEKVEGRSADDEAMLFKLLGYYEAVLHSKHGIGAYAPMHAITSRFTQREREQARRVLKDAITDGHFTKASICREGSHKPSECLIWAGEWKVKTAA